MEVVSKLITAEPNSSPIGRQIGHYQVTDDWRREKITFTVAEGDRAIAYLYLPKQHPPPWQVIQFVPPR